MLADLGATGVDAYVRITETSTTYTSIKKIKKKTDEKQYSIKKDSETFVSVLLIINYDFSG